MAQKQGIEGMVGSHPLSSAVQHKIQDVLKSTLQQELSKEEVTKGVVGARHGSVTHGSVELQ